MCLEERNGEKETKMRGGKLKRTFKLSNFFSFSPCMILFTFIFQVVVFDTSLNIKDYLFFRSLVISR